MLGVITDENATSQDRGPSRLVKKGFDGLHELVRLFYERKCPLFSNITKRA